MSDNKAIKSILHNFGEQTKVTDIRIKDGATIISK